jgi:cytosine/adenosine deaminase-related metal-dependent hydrolase
MLSICIVLVTLHCAPLVLPMSTPPITAGAVAVAGDRVVGVGGQAELAAAYPDARVRAWAGMLLPGLVNAHSHLQYTDFADLATGGLAFSEWIGIVTERRWTYSPEQWAESARRGIHGMLSTGTTACADVVSDPGPLGATARSGLGGVSYVEAVGADSAGWRAKLLAQTTSRLDKAPPLRAIGVSPHSLYTLGREAIGGCCQVARQRGLRLHPHLAETAEEVEYVAAGSGRFADYAARFGWEMELVQAGGSGRTPCAELDAMGALGPDVHVAHGVHCDAEDRALLRRRGTAVALCVRSNRILGAGEAPVAAYLDEGSPIAVGTDSLASSPSHDLVEELAAGRELARRQGYAAADLERRLVEAATLGGAQALGKDDIGRLGPGARADLAVFDVPLVGDPYQALIDHGAGRCVATVLAGHIVHRQSG